MIYLASPFSKYPLGAEAAFIDISRIAGRLIMVGKDIFSPIVHGFPIAIYGGVDPYDAELWNRINAPWMARASELYIAKLDGWKASEGIQHEMQTFLSAGKPIFFLDPATLELTPAIERSVA